MEGEVFYQDCEGRSYEEEEEEEDDEDEDEQPEGCWSKQDCEDG